MEKKLRLRMIGTRIKGKATSVVVADPATDQQAMDFLVKNTGSSEQDIIDEMQINRWLQNESK